MLHMENTLLVSPGTLDSVYKSAVNNLALRCWLAGVEGGFRICFRLTHPSLKGALFSTQWLCPVCVHVCSHNSEILRGGASSCANAFPCCPVRTDLQTLCTCLTGPKCGHHGSFRLKEMGCLMTALGQRGKCENSLGRVVERRHGLQSLKTFI